MTTVLQFGGGKDSLACLQMLKPRWHEITVLWMNTGASFPEVTALMERVRSQVPHFQEVKADVFSSIARHGMPVDVLPVLSTAFNRAIKPDGPLLRTWMECCRDNMWLPLQKATNELRATTIIRGQRNAEGYKSTLRHGDVVDGVRYEFPLQDWSESDVFEYLTAEGVEIPDYYRYTGTSLDCWNCTAFLDAKLGQLRYMKERHPDKYQQVRGNLELIHRETSRQLNYLQEALA